jgi:hypothetical protein
MSEVSKDGIDPITKVKDLIRECYDPDVCGWTADRSRGNSDDVFDDGHTSGYSYALWTIGKLLNMDLPDPKEPEY